MKILLLEDDMILSEVIQEYLIELDFDVDIAYEGYEALDMISNKRYDLLILDVGVPNLNGFELLEYLKDVNINIPAIYITSLNTAKDIEKAFNIGCDDYIKKPFELKELEVRINHLKKRLNLGSDRLKLTNNILYDFTIKAIIKENKEYHLSPKEALILEYFIKNQKRFISLEELSSNVWSLENTPTYATIRTYIKNLRKLLGKELLVTRKGVGYKFEI